MSDTGLKQDYSPEPPRKRGRPRKSGHQTRLPSDVGLPPEDRRQWPLVKLVRKTASRVRSLERDVLQLTLLICALSLVGKRYCVERFRQRSLYERKQLVIALDDLREHQQALQDCSSYYDQLEYMNVLTLSRGVHRQLHPFSTDGRRQSRELHNEYMRGFRAARKLRLQRLESQVTDLIPKLSVIDPAKILLEVITQLVAEYKQGREETTAGPAFCEGSKTRQSIRRRMRVIKDDLAVLGVSIT